MLLEYSRDVGAIRPGFDRFLAYARTQDITLFLASGGFDFYIHEILGDRITAFEELWYNVGRPNGVSVDVSFPHQERSGCIRCAVCKGRICERVARDFDEVFFAGDGASDACAVGKADRLFVVEESKLHRQAERVSSPAEPFKDFDDLLSLLLP